MNKILIKLLALIVVSIAIQSCHLSNREIEDKAWKFADMRRGDSSLPLRRC